MKTKIILLLLLLTSFESFAQKVSLNGYDSVTCRQMRKDFITFTQNSSSVFKKAVSIYFDSKTLTNMMTIVQNETGPTGQPLNGIRIYPGLKDGRFTIIVVPTYDNGTNANGQTIRQDFFDYTENDAQTLLRTAGINGIVNNNGGSDQGAALFAPCPSCAAQCPPPANTVHYITRKHAEELVANRSTDNGPFNTNFEWFPVCFFSNINPATYGGLRIYYAKHLSGDELYPGRDTFVVEVTKDANGLHQDIFDCNFSFCPPSDLGLLLNNQLFEEKSRLTTKRFKRKLMKAKRYVIGNGVENGELCPSNCDGATLPLM